MVYLDNPRVKALLKRGKLGYNYVSMIDNSYKMSVRFHVDHFIFLQLETLTGDFILLSV